MIRQTSMVLTLLALHIALRQDSPEALLHRMQAAVKAASEDQVTALFQDKHDGDYLLRMAKRCGGLKGLKVAVFSSPNGWERTGKYWAMFHTWQELEQDHDPIYRVVNTPQGLELGPEIPEYDCNGFVNSVDSTVDLSPTTGDVHFLTNVKFVAFEPHKALLFRLQDSFSNLEVWHDLASTPIPAAKSDEIASMKHGFLRVGSLLAVLPNEDPLPLAYSAHIGAGASYSDDRDQISSDHAYVTSFWAPSLGRVPFISSVKVGAPKDWVVRSEGNLLSTSTERAAPGYMYSSFKCPFPISYPKVSSGKYVLALEGNQNGHILRSYQFAPIDAKRAANDMEWMKKAMAFYEVNLGPFPFKEYDCFDGKNYYGIESYSYTILAPSITTWAVSHEMGHTYFGGLVPCPYVKDSWNEGLTQYVDDVLLHHNPEVEQNAFAGIKIKVPLTQMPVAWEYNGATYWRGAYAMEMLDAEIGHDKVMQGLRAIIKDRVGKETTWPDLRQYFEKSSGQDLKWFWDQWVAGSVFPHVMISSAVSRQDSGKWVTTIKAKQTGTDAPFHLRFKIRLSDSTSAETSELMTESEHTFEIVTDFQPKQAVIDPTKMSLISVDAPVPISGDSLASARG